jgi:hypothetical protein
VLDIKFFPDLPQQIIEAAEQKQLAIFVGAGLSRFMGCSSWGELAENLLKKCEAEGLLNNYEKTVLSQSTDFKKTITICSRLLKNDERFMDEMRKSLNDDKVGDASVDLKIYKDLFSLNGLIITTNADRHIDQVYLPDNIFINDFSSATPVDNTHLYKIHGSITDPNSLIFTVEGYLKRYTDYEYGKFLEEIFTKYTVLFLGYGMSEFELMDYLFSSIQGNSKRHYFLKDYFTHEQRIYKFDQMYFDDLGVKLIPYAKDSIGYQQLPKIIDEWVQEIKSKTLVLVTNYDDIDDALGNPL